MRLIRLCLWDGCQGGTIAVSDDDGATWQQIPAPSASGRTQYVGFAGGRLYRSSSGGGLYTSADRGATWRTLIQDDGHPYSGLTARAIVELAGNLWVASDQTITFGTDDELAGGGGTRFTTGLQMPTRGGSALFALSPTRLVVKAAGGLYEVDPTGAAPLAPPATWTAIAGSELVANVVRYRSAFFDLGGARPQVRLTTDDGATWMAFDQGLDEYASAGFGTGARALLVGRTGEIWRTSLE